MSCLECVGLTDALCDQGKGGAMEPENFYREIRDQIKHEDYLCDHRMTWLITLQAFLFGAYGFSLSAAGAANAEKINDVIAYARAGFAIAGALSSLAVFLANFAARKSIDRLIKKWMEYARNKNIMYDNFPYIIGNYSENYGGWVSLGQIPLFSIPVILPPVWIYIITGSHRLF